MNQRLVSPVLMWAIVTAGFVCSFLTLPRLNIIAPNTVMQLFMIPGAVYWSYFLWTGSIVHADGLKSAAAQRTIVTNGPYRFVRHPMYQAHIVLAWSLFFRFPSIRVGAGLIWLTAVIIYWALLEERALLKKFGVEYARYRARVPMLIPRFREKPDRSEPRV